MRRFTLRARLNASILRSLIRPMRRSSLRAVMNTVSAFGCPQNAAQQLAAVLPAVSRVMRAGGVVFCETAKGVELPERAGGLVKIKEYRYGRTMVYSYRKEDDE